MQVDLNGISLSHFHKIVNHFINNRFTHFLFSLNVVFEMYLKSCLSDNPFHYKNQFDVFHVELSDFQIIVK